MRQGLVTNQRAGRRGEGRRPGGAVENAAITRLRRADRATQRSGFVSWTASPHGRARELRRSVFMVALARRRDTRRRPFGAARRSVFMVALARRRDTRRRPFGAARRSVFMVALARRRDTRRRPFGAARRSVTRDGSEREHDAARWRAG